MNILNNNTTHETVRFHELFSINNLKKISDENIQHFTAVGIDKMDYDNFTDQQSEITGNISRKVNDGSYEFTRYKEKLILKDRYSLPRCISIPTLTDRVCLKACHEYLNAKLSDFGVERLPLPQESIKSVSEALDDNEFDYFIQLDISDFYGSINHFLLFNILKSEINNTIFLDLIKKAIENTTGNDDPCSINKNIVGVPQGLSISNILAHIYMVYFDNKYKDDNRLFYTRYVDDILIFCNKTEKKQILKDLIYDLERNHMLSLNLNKFREGKIDESSFRFLGYCNKKSNDNSQLLSVPKSKVVKLQDRIMAKITKYKKTRNVKKGDGYPKYPTAQKILVFELNLMISGAISKKIDKETTKVRRYGWIFYYSQLTDLTILYELDAFIHKKLDKILDNNERNQVFRNLKSFSRAYYETRFNLANSKYFLMPDEFNLAKQKKFLRETYNLTIKSSATEKEIEKLFYRYCYKRIRDENEDVLRGNS